MVFDFVQSGRHQDFLVAVHQACGHLQDLLNIDHPEEDSDDLASAITRPDAIRHHLENDAMALLKWHEEVNRLIGRFPLAKVELDKLDPLDTSRLLSLLSRAESSLTCAIRSYPELIKFQKDAQSRPANFSLFIESIHQNLAEARIGVAQMEAIVARLVEKQDRESYKPSQARISQVSIGPNNNIGAFEGQSMRIEASDYFAKQWQHGEVPLRDFQIACRKAVHFTESGNVPSTPWHGEPHCYGSAPNHLNGVVVGSSERLIYYVDQNNGSASLKLCAWISHSEHKDAFSRLKHQNLYRRIITDDRASKITRLDFAGFEELKV